ncbi:MAG: DUF5666 domain-containing protein [Terriglobia bacterium]
MKATALAWVLPIMVALTGLTGFNGAVPARASARRALQTQPQAAAPGTVVRSMGAIETIQGSAITLKTNSGSEVNVAVQDSTRMLRIQPGQKSLKGATPLRLQDLQVGDRILVIGKTSGDAKSVLASSIIAMKQSDIEQKQQEEEEAWQKHGVGGLVREVDAGTGTITLAPNGAGKTITVHTSKDTVLRRYAPGSVRYQDAKPGTFDQIKPGDQLRARGILSPDGSEITAAEIVSGSFQNIAGIVTSVDPSANEVTVMDLVTKKPVAVKIVAQSELRKLPELTARSIAARLKRERVSASPAAGAGAGAAQASNLPAPKAGNPDLDQILSGLPQIKVQDLHKGDAVMIVSTQGAPSAAVTAIKLLSGVAPILTASPGGNQAKALRSLWSGFGASGGGGESGGTGDATPASR